jgi:hypothetical protein
MVIRQPLPLEFILSRVSLTRSDVKVGLFRKLLATEDVAVLVDRGLLDEGELAFDLEKELVAILPPDWAAIGDPSEYPQHAAPELRLAEERWVYLQLAWLWDHQAESSNALDEIELLYADFGYPTEIEGLVRWMPAKPGEPMGEPAMMDRWSKYLADCGARFGQGADRTA